MFRHCAIAIAVAMALLALLVWLATDVEPALSYHADRVEFPAVMGDYLIYAEGEVVRHENLGAVQNPAG